MLNNPQRNQRVIILLVGVFVVAFGPPLASRVRAQPNQAVANASVTVLKPISLINLWPMSFGKLAPSPAGGTAQMVVSDIAVGDISTAYYYRAPVTTGAVVALVNQEGSTAPGPAIFKASGTLDFFFGITLPNAITVELTTTDVVADPMLLDNFISNIGLTGQLTGGIGQMYFAVGGTLHVGPSQPAGNYSATFPVSVFYN